MSKLGFRPAAIADYGFALRTKNETMKPYASEYWNWDEGEQEARFAEHYRQDEATIILLGGEPIGWYAVREDDNNTELLQFYIAPAHQRQGIGTNVLKRLVDQWRLEGKRVTLGVLKNNPARRLYERFGFAVIGENDTKLLMERPGKNEK